MCSALCCYWHLGKVSPNYIQMLKRAMTVIWETEKLVSISKEECSDVYMDKNNVLLNFSTCRGSRDKPILNSWTLTSTSSEKDMNLIGLHQSAGILDLMWCCENGTHSFQNWLSQYLHCFLRTLLHTYSDSGFITPTVAIGEHIS